MQRVTKISFEALVGAMFTLALAIGILLFGENLDALEAAFFGDISQVTLELSLIGIARLHRRCACYQSSSTINWY